MSWYKKPYSMALKKRTLKVKKHATERIGMLEKRAFRQLKYLVVCHANLYF